MERSTCCHAPIVREYLHNLQEQDRRLIFESEIPVDVCSSCGSILVAHIAHEADHDTMLETAK